MNKSTKSNQRTQRLSGIPRLETISLATMVMFVVFCFRAEMHSSYLLLAIETIVLMMLPLALLMVILQRKDLQGFDGRSWLYALQVMALPFVFIPLALQPVWRQLSMGDPNEIIVLCMVAQLTWYLAVFSAVYAFERTSFMTGAALILFVCFMTQSASVYTFAFLYAILALWWLFGEYWGKVSTKAIDGQTRTLPIRGFTIGSALVVLVLVGMIANSLSPGDRLASVRGFMPTSGGDSWTEEFARSGIGDGDMLAAGQDASTTGPVDSDQFIEDDRPSMYDITSDQFEGPLKIKKRRNRAQALDTTAKHMHDVIRSEQQGRSFRTVRKTRQGNQKLKDRITDGLFFVEGPVPARFAVDCFHHFDGWDWSKIDLDEVWLSNPPITLQESGGKPWYVVQNQKREFLESRRAHRVKIMRLDTKAIPATPMIKSWHIHRVNMKDMFHWNKQGVVCMSGEVIPTHTMIDMISKVPNYYVLEHSRNPLASEQPHPWWEFVDRFLGVASETGTSKGKYNPIETNTDSPLLQIPENETKPRIDQLVTDWTAGHQPGWPQVNAIIQRLRADFQCSAELTASDDGRDSVASFLDQEGGTSYQFASAATQMLRAAGYRTRLMRGFMITHDDYDSVARQSVVTSENLHMWPEVCLDGWHWIPVEPNPNFPEPVSSMTAWQWVKSQIFAGTRWVFRNPLTTLAVLSLVGLIVWFRRNIFAAGYWAYWFVQTVLFPGKKLAATRRLLDVRFWVAGLPRPSYSTINSWCAQLEDTSDLPFFDYWNTANFSVSSASPRPQEIHAACRQVISKFSLRKISEFANDCEQDES
ncbi:MAG: transglutaminase-like domain-containing protein [Planctomycetota bacterium]